ncbi:hypothetical protein [Pseudomonas sp. SDO55104_S430]
MTKVIEVTHFRTEKFTLTRAELVAALTAKYGEEPVFKEGRLQQVFNPIYFLDGNDFESTDFVFQVDQVLPRSTLAR